MKKNLTELVFILDRSGSMAGLEKDTIGGFNSMIEKQKAEGNDVVVTTVLFNQETQVIHDRVDIQKLPALTEKDYAVGGYTALLDAVGRMISHIQTVHKYIRKEDRPSRTLFVITTDGMENASRLYTYPTLKLSIEAQKEKDWEFIFLGANIDAIGEASRFGIGADFAANYHADSRGTKAVFGAVGNAIHSACTRAPVSASWKQELDKDFQQRKK